MDFAPLERRRDHRKTAYTPVTFREYDSSEFTPAHLIDVSLGGAGLLTTESNAPVLGQQIDIQFETVTEEGGTETQIRRQAGVVVNTRHPQRGITRIGVRFIHRSESGGNLFAPRELLSNERRPFINTTSRWQTAKHFESSFASTSSMN
jgi:hypothetical protein